MRCQTIQQIFAGGAGFGPVSEDCGAAGDDPGGHGGDGQGAGVHISGSAVDAGKERMGARVCTV